MSLQLSELLTIDLFLFVYLSPQKNSRAFKNFTVFLFEIMCSKTQSLSYSFSLVVICVNEKVIHPVQSFFSKYFFSSYFLNGFILYNCIAGIQQVQKM